VRRLGELDIGVADDLDAVASGVEKIEERTGQRLDARFGQRAAHRFLVVDDQAALQSGIAAGHPASGTLARERFWR
jgi:hypothetical protein